MSAENPEVMPVVRPSGNPDTGAPETEIGYLLRLALTGDRPVPVETIEKLVALKERAEDRDARSQFFAAVAAFQDECPPIRRSRRASVASQGGSGFSYTYADLEEIVRTVRPILAKMGLSFTHDSKVGLNGMLEVVCTLRHVAGHSESASFPCPTSSRAGMSDAQKYASALTFARRQSLIQVLGLTTTDQDLDGAGEEREPITDAQAHQIEEWISKCHEPGKERAAFLAYLGADSVDAIPAVRFDDALAAITKVAKKRGSGA